MNAAELANLRRQVETSFTTTATVCGKVPVADTSGGFTDSYPPRATYPCSFAKQPSRPREVETASRIQLVAAWTFVFPTDAEIRSTDRIRVGTRTFEVVEAGIGSADVVLKVVCLEVV